MPYFVSDEILDKFKNQSLTDIFDNIEVVENNLGDFIKIINPFETIRSENIIFPQEIQLFEYFIKRKLTLINGVSKRKSENLRKKGLNNIEQLVGLAPRKFSEAKDILKLITTKNDNELKKIKNINDEDLIFCVKPEDILFLDIETTGMTGAEIFLIGIGFLSKKENSAEYFFTTELLFAREISEEAAILKYFVDLLPNFKMFVSYNGKGFDIPFICNRIGTLFESKDIEGIFKYFVKNRLPKSPNYEEIEWPLAMIKAIVSGFIHFDLYYAVRRTYKDLLPDHRLVTAEEHILDFFREEHLPSSEVPAVYLDYLSDEKHIYMGALYKVIEHNFYDVINMELLLKEWIILNIQNNYKEIEKQLKNGIKYKPLAQNSLHSLEKIEKLEKYLSLKRGIKMQTLDEFSK